MSDGSIPKDPVPINDCGTSSLYLDAKFETQIQAMATLTQWSESILALEKVTSSQVTELSSRLDVLQSKLGVLPGLTAQLQSVLGMLQNEKQSSDALRQFVEGIHASLVNLNGVSEQRQATTESMLVSLQRTSDLRFEETRLARLALLNPAGSFRDAPKVSRDFDLSRSLRALKDAAPENFVHWIERFRRSENEMMGLNAQDLSVAGNAMSEHFEWFVRAFAHGTVLDLGCGPQFKPTYLRCVPDHAIVGIDPVSPSTVSHPFDFVKCLAEDLPWDDGVFQTVVCATSLDHVFLLDSALAEVRRTMSADGDFLVWSGIAEHAGPYDPFVELEPIDEFHLFHFSQSSLEHHLSKSFQILDSFHFPGHVFLRARPLRN
jgi:SAM-dependent methyltransferase